MSKAKGNTLVSNDESQKLPRYAELQDMKLPHWALGVMIQTQIVEKARVLIIDIETDNIQPVEVVNKLNKLSSEINSLIEMIFDANDGLKELVFNQEDEEA